jgi:hypothetical protein
MKSEGVQVSADYPWKILHALAKDCISASALREDDAALLDQIIRDRDVAAVMTLGDIWGLQCIVPFTEGYTLDEIRGRRLLAGLLKKFMFVGSEEQRKAAALNSFIDAEERCKRFNHDGWKALSTDKYLREVVRLAQVWISKILGERPQWQELVHWVRFGPGSTLDSGGERGVSAFVKYADWPYTVTVDSVRYARFFIETDQRWMGALTESYRLRKGIPMHYPLDMRQFWSDVFDVVDGNRIGFVPKSSVTDRTIAIEPLMNLYLQLGVDGKIRRALKRFDIDLDDQSKNQVLAALGSEMRGNTSNLYSTLDLKGASDGVSLAICRLLFPEAWYRFLVDLASPTGFIPGVGKVRYEKLSSMGNGYTFAVESLIFAALTQAVIRLESGRVNFQSDMAIYGDDIIVREAYAKGVIHVLQSCGFVINRDKSFIYGIVKESCGTDWYQGQEVRSVSIDAVPETVMELFVDRNKLARILNIYFGINRSFVAATIESWIPPSFMRFKGPRSDTEFATYLHEPSMSAGRYSAGRWRYHRLVIRPVETLVVGWESFSFRKLMVALRDRPLRRSPFELGPSGGNQFAVYVTRKSVTVGETCRPAHSFWQDQYADETTSFLFRSAVQRRSQLFAKRLFRWLDVSCNSLHE